MVEHACVQVLEKLCITLTAQVHQGLTRCSIKAKAGDDSIIKITVFTYVIINVRYHQLHLVSINFGSTYFNKNVIICFWQSMEILCGL